MSWTTPKTDWDASYRWDKVDINRIQDNLLYLQEYCTLLFSAPVYATMRTNLEYTDSIYASDMNKITNNLKALNTATFKFTLPALPTFYANQSTPTYTYFNAVESTLAAIKTKLDVNTAILAKLPIRLGNAKGVKE